jgi:hypothetical protein
MSILNQNQCPILLKVSQSHLFLYYLNHIYIYICISPLVALGKLLPSIVIPTTSPIVNILTTLGAPLFIPTYTRWQRYDGEITNGARKIDEFARVIHRSVMLFVDMTPLLSCLCVFKSMLVIVEVLI